MTGGDIGLEQLLTLGGKRHGAIEGAGGVDFFLELGLGGEDVSGARSLQTFFLEDGIGRCFLSGAGRGGQAERENRKRSKHGRGSVEGGEKFRRSANNLILRGKPLAGKRLCTWTQLPSSFSDPGGWGLVIETPGVWPRTGVSFETRPQPPETLKETASTCLAYARGVGGPPITTHQPRNLR